LLAFAALLNELRGPLTGVAATLSKSKGNAAGATANAFAEDDLKKVRGPPAWRRRAPAPPAADAALAAAPPPG